MPWVFRYFWFIGAVVMLINIVLWRRRLLVVVEKGRATPAELQHFTKWASICLIGGPLVLGTVSMAAGWPSPFCAGVMQFTDIPTALVSLATLAGWIGLLWWVWRGNGADFLARVAPALGQRPVYDKSYSPAMIRLVVTVLVVAGGAGSVLAWRSMPVRPEMACRVSAVAD